MKRAMVVILVIFLAGCESGGPKLLEIMARDFENPKQYSLRIAEMESSAEIETFKSQDFVFLRDMVIYPDDFHNFVISSKSYREFRDELRNRFGGQFINGSLILNNGIYEGKDIESLTFLSTFYHLNKIINFSKNIGLSQPPDMLMVGFNTTLYSYEGSMNLGDNATYVGAADLLLIMAHPQNQGQPVVINEANLAHEYHHRLFFYKVWVMATDPQLWSIYKTSYVLNDWQRWQILLSSLDEGLADLFAVSYAEHPNFLSLSLGNEKSAARQRDLTGDFSEQATYDNLADSSLNEDLLSFCRGPSLNFTNQQFNIYCLGTVIAKSFFEASSQNPQHLRNLALPIIHHALGMVSDKIAKKEEFDLHIFFDAVAQRAKTVNEIFYQKICDQIGTRFASLSKSGKIPSCP